MTRQEYLDIYDVVGAAMEVYNTLGRGMSELIYQEALEIEMRKREMSFEREKPLHLYYKTVLLKKIYVADFYYKGVIVELKSVEHISSDHRAQLFNYMRMTHKERGVLLNFGEIGLRAERYLYVEDDDNFVLLSQDNYKEYIQD
jgi:GxxExxY protein